MFAPYISQTKQRWEKSKLEQSDATFMYNAYIP